MRKTSLHGLRILNTRPLEQGLELNQQIEALGGIPVALPMLEIKPTDSAWINHLPPLSTIDFVIFTSSNAVTFFLKEIPPRKIPSQWQVVAIGQATAQRLKEQGVRVDAIPSVADSEHLLALSNFVSCENKTILLVKGKNGRELIQNTLTQRKAHIISLSVYERIPSYYPAQTFTRLWQEDALDIILFTSQEGMQTFFNQLPIECTDWIKTKPCVVLSDRLAKIAQDYGIKSVQVSAHDTLIECFIERNCNDRKTS